MLEVVNEAVAKMMKDIIEKLKRMKLSRIQFFQHQNEKVNW